jgi:hypothetical protein
LSLLVIALCNRSVELSHPPDWERDLRILFGACPPSSAEVCARLKLVAADDNSFTIFEDGGPAIEALSRNDALLHLSEIVTRRLAENVDIGVSLHSGVVGWNGRSVLIPGDSGAGKSSLTAWFVSKGFDYVSDELAVLNGEAIVGFPRSLMLRSGADTAVSQLPRFADFTMRPSRGSETCHAGSSSSPHSNAALASRSSRSAQQKPAFDWQRVLVILIA